MRFWTRLDRVWIVGIATLLSAASAPTASADTQRSELVIAGTAASIAGNSFTLELVSSQAADCQAGSVAICSPAPVACDSGGIGRSGASIATDLASSINAACTGYDAEAAGNLLTVTGPPGQVFGSRIQSSDESAGCATTGYELAPLLEVNNVCDASVGDDDGRNPIGASGLHFLQNDSEIVDDQILVKFLSSASIPDQHQLISDCDTGILFDSTQVLDEMASSPFALTPLAPAVSDLARNIFTLELLSGQSVPDAVGCFEARPDLVDFAEPDFILEPDSHRSNHYPNDPLFMDGTQWNLLNAGQPGSSAAIGTIDADIDAVQSWDLPHTDCSNVIVAVFDTGADLDHPDLAANLYTNPNETPGNGIDDDNNGYVDDIHGFDFTELAPNTFPFVDAGGDGPEDTVSGHGTHVAGIIGAVGNNGTQISGICWKANMVILRIGNPRASATRLMEATVYLTTIPQFGPAPLRVANLSMATTHTLTNEGVKTNFQLLELIGVLVVQSAGNDGLDLDADANADQLPDHPTYPCNSGEKTASHMCVAASNNTDTLWLGSNFGSASVDLAAPGFSIKSLWLAGGTSTRSGTSMAAPHVSGIAALAFALFPSKEPVDVKDDILYGARPFPVASGVEIVKTSAANTIFGKVNSNGRLRWPYTGDLGDAPNSYDTIAAAPNTGALHWDYGNEYLGTDASPEVDADATPDQDLSVNLAAVDTDLHDHPLGTGNGGFKFDPEPPWEADTEVTVEYKICSDYLGILDADGGRYQGGMPDRTIYVNAFFDVSCNFEFEPAELLLEDIISPPPSPPPPAKPANPNVSINQHPVLPAPTAAPVFPPPRTCRKITSSFVVPFVGCPDNPKWIRFRLDYAEDMEINDSKPVLAEDTNLPTVQHHQWARHGDVEDFLLPLHKWVFSGTAQGGTVSATIKGVEISITTTAGQTPQQVAAAFAAAVNANTALTSMGVHAVSQGATVILSGVGGEDVATSIDDPGLGHGFESVPSMPPPARMPLYLLLLAMGGWYAARRGRGRTGPRTT